MFATIPMTTSELLTHPQFITLFFFTFWKGRREPNRTGLQAVSEPTRESDIKYTKPLGEKSKSVLRLKSVKDPLIPEVMWVFPVG